MEWRLQPRPGPQAARVSRQRVILLAGLPGSGKTTVAVQLQSLGWVWVNQVHSSSLLSHCRCLCQSTTLELYSQHETLQPAMVP